MDAHHSKGRKRFRDHFSKVMNRKRSDGIPQSYSIRAATVSLESELPSDGQELQRDTTNNIPAPFEQSPCSDSGSEYPRASLLGIPGELRNTIYRYALLEDQLVKLSPQNHQLPGLLRTCSQIRDEANEIYQIENNFQVDAWNMKLCIPKNYAEHWMSSLEHSHFWITMRGSTDWKNFMVWLRRYSTGEVPGLASGQPTVEAEVLAQAFEIVHGMKKLLPFEQIEPVLEAWKKSVVLVGADFVFP